MRRLLAAILGASAVAAAVAAMPTPAVAASVHTHALHGLAAGRAAIRHSFNWAGYIKTGGHYTSVSGSWRVPALRTNVNGYSATWVGVDGALGHDPYLLQTGTEQDVVRGRASYYAWYEVITPTHVAPETPIRSMTIHAGDSMTATVAHTAAGTWTVTLRDNTSRVTASVRLAFAGPGRSAEWIEEDTDVNGTISAAPDWQSVAFANVSVNGGNPNLKSRQAVDLEDTRGTVEATTGTPVNGNAFTITWRAPGTPTRVG
ncbi:MAG TPA: G1 family glutamic endopeptidase [Micromonosporaceae bacterium]|jgi:hypothetical protein